MKKAVEWLDKAAKRGNAAAQCQMGAYCTLTGVVEENENMLFEGVNWWRGAAEQGHPDAQYLLGTFYSGAFYRDGKGHNKDVINMAEAVKWYRQAAAQGHAQAKETLRQIEMNGQSDGSRLETALPPGNPSTRSARGNRQ
jgi:TPR repeat protein